MNQSLGEYRVGKDFNPSNNITVDEIKRMAAQFIDYLDYPYGEGEFCEQKRLIALAQIHIEDAAMWAVKAVTKKERV